MWRSLFRAVIPVIVLGMLGAGKADDGEFGSLFSFRFSAASAEEYSEHDANYGKTWMYFADGDNKPQIANLTEPPPDGNSRGRTKSVRERTRFELYK